MLSLLRVGADFGSGLPDGLDFNAPMQSHIQNLAKLQSVDQERTRLSQEARALPGQVKQAEANLSAAQGRASAVSDALTREDELRTRLEREIAVVRQKASRFRAQQDTVTTPAQAAAIDHELGFTESEIDRLENEELASLERSEAQEATLAAARKEVEDLAAALEKTRERVIDQQKRIGEEVIARDGERQTLRQAIDPELLARFDRIASTRGTGMARAENQQCAGCRMGLRPQIWNLVRQGEVLTCDSCGRLLYWDPAISVPSPKAPQTEPMTSDGHVIRKPRPAGA